MSKYPRVISLIFFPERLHRCETTLQTCNPKKMLNDNNANGTEMVQPSTLAMVIFFGTILFTTVAVTMKSWLTGDLYGE